MSATQHEFNILGQKIVIKNQEEAQLASLALEVVNGTVAKLQEKYALLGPQQIAVLALLEVAGDLVKDRKSIDEYRSELDRKCSTLMNEMAKIHTHPNSSIAV